MPQGWDGAGQYAAAESYAGWASFLREHPKVLWGLIADVVKAVKAAEGERKTGRRPAVSVGSLDELYAVLFPPTYSTLPFPQAFAQALGTRSQRAFAMQAGMNQGTVSRLISGHYEPTVQTIERIAKALKIRPTYFQEYRAMKIGQVVTEVLMEHPEMSTECIRRLVGAGR